MHSINVQMIRKNLIVFSIVLIVCIIVSAVSLSILNVKKNNNQTLKSDILSYNTRVNDMLHNISIVNTYEKDYNKLLNTGFVENENRLPWIEQLENTAARLQLLDLQYQFDAQQQLIDGRFAIPDNIDVFESALNIKVGLLHEEDLVTLISELASLSSGVYVIKHCQLNRLVERVDVSGKRNFNVDCDLLLYTAKYQQSGMQQMSNEP